MRYSNRNFLIILSLFLLQIRTTAFADWIDFQQSDVTESEGIGAVSVNLVRTDPSADAAFAYLSLQDITTDASDYDFDSASIDRGFNSPGFALLASNSPGTILWLREYADGRLLVGGYWDEVNGNPTPNILRLLADGTVDSTFLANLQNNGRISYDAYLLANSKAYVTFAFTDPQGGIQVYLVRLNEDGSIDQSFSQVTADRAIQSFDVQSNGNIVVGGTFGRVNGQVRAGVARILADGTLDQTFNTGFPETWRDGTGGFVHALKIQPDGKVIVAGELDTWGAADVDAIVRLDQNGALDPSFALPPVPFRNQIFDLELLPGGRMIVPHSDGISMFETNGDLVPGFSASLVGAVHDIGLQHNGQILIAGRFTEVNAQALNTIARLNPDGSIDATFEVGIIADNISEAVMERRSGRILLGGGWTTFGGQSESNLLQLNGNMKANWNANQGGNRTIDIALVDDLVYEGDEQFELQIASVGEGTVEKGTAESSTVTISDNDPFLDQPIGVRSATVGQLLTLDVSANFVHPESAPLTFSATGLPSSLSISTDGVIRGTPASSDSTSSPYSVDVTATDSAGAMASGMFNLSITDPPAQQSSGGGSMGLYFLSVIWLFLIRRKYLIPHRKHKR